MRWPLAFLALLLLICSVMGIAPTNPGDPNNDGVVNALDAQLVAACLNQNAVNCQGGRADVNNDGTVDIFDLVHVGQYWGRSYGQDTTPPSATITAPQQNQVFPSGTTSVILTVQTNEPAVCKHHGSNVPFAQMSNTFQGANGTNHTSGTSGLTDGVSRTRYVLCQDLASNTMVAPISVTFSVATSNATCGNGIVEGTEACDGADFSGKTCQTLGFSGGTLSCTTQCTLDTSTCTGTPSNLHPNEPAGFTQLTSRPFDAKVENGWGDRGDAAFTIIQDPLAPYSPQNIGSARFGAGGTGGTGPIMTGFAITGQYKRLYISHWIQLSSNWEAHPSGVNKIFHIWIDGGNKVYTNSHGTSASNMKARIHFQGIGVQTPGQGFPSWNGVPNVNAAAAIIVPGSWHHWEIFLQTNTPGVPDGTARWWLDGVLVGDYTNVGYIDVGGSPYWTNVVWNPTWGGAGGTRNQTFYMYQDHIYISAAP